MILPKFNHGQRTGCSPPFSLPSFSTHHVTCINRQAGPPSAGGDVITGFHSSIRHLNTSLTSCTVPIIIITCGPVTLLLCLFQKTCTNSFSFAAGSDSNTLQHSFKRSVLPSLHMFKQEQQQSFTDSGAFSFPVWSLYIFVVTFVVFDFIISSLCPGFMCTCVCFYWGLLPAHHCK